ncbi:MAG: 3-oxoacyl-[acyl-carrier-protein] reductase [bacterium]|nr:3-oxoacyl-[acyl-carrier-protein] reductase [bacterium]
MKLGGKTAVVTGSAQGIGKEIACSLAKEGANVVVSDIDLELAEQTAAEIRKMGRETLVIKADVSMPEEAANIIEKTIDKLGSLDILINNAGITRDNFILRMKDEDWDKVLAINLKGTFNCIKAAAKVMLKQRKGKIVNMASIIGLIGNAGQANYAASKAGVIALTKSAAKEFGSRGITVNAIAPGFISTRMTEVLKEDTKQKMLGNIPLGRFGLPTDVANLVLFLVSDEANYITGQVINVDGGMVT